MSNWHYLNPQHDHHSEHNLSPGVKPHSAPLSQVESARPSFPGEHSKEATAEDNSKTISEQSPRVLPVLLLQHDSGFQLIQIKQQKRLSNSFIGKSPKMLTWGQKSAPDMFREHVFIPEESGSQSHEAVHLGQNSISVKCYLDGPLQISDNLEESVSISLKYP